MNRAVYRHPRRWGLANCLTLFRLAIAAPLMVMLALAGWREAFVAMMAASFLSDFLDGTVARLTGGTTRFGALLDSWADGAAYCAIALGVCLLWPRLVAHEWAAIIVIVASFLVPGLVGWLKFRRLTSYHTVLVKVAAAATAAALLVVLSAGPTWPLRAAAALALLAGLEEIAITCVLRAPRSNIAGLWRAWRAAENR